MNELRIHTIAYLQLHVCHSGKVFLALALALDQARYLDLALASGSVFWLLALAYGSGSGFWIWHLDSGSVSGLGSGSGSGSGSYSIYGESWVDKLKSSSSMSKFYCITDMTRFMMKEAENLMKGSVHKDNLFIVHDALMLMTSKEAIECMK